MFKLYVPIHAPVSEWVKTQFIEVAQCFDQPKNQYYRNLYMTSQDRDIQFKHTRISRRYAPFILAPPGGFGGPSAHHCGPSAQSQQHLIFSFPLPYKGGVCFLNFSDWVYVA